MPSSNRESQRDGRSHHNDRNNPSGRSPPPFKRHRNDYEQSASGNNRAPSPPAARGPRQRAENTLSSISVPGFGRERAPQRGGLNTQPSRRLPPGSAANAHLQDNQGRRYNR
ncbi:hypothetical protein DSO57_1036781 [Entomophthora muscae]|nr:hypothetical protein DSO57_1036781 [Entomophthora muscae]